MDSKEREFEVNWLYRKKLKEPFFSFFYSVEWFIGTTDFLVNKIVLKKQQFLFQELFIQDPLLHLEDSSRFIRKRLWHSDDPEYIEQFIRNKCPMLG